GTFGSTCHTARGTINWGDGTADPAVIDGDDQSGFKVYGSHTFGEEGSYLVTVNIPDPQSGPDGVAYGTSTIADAPLTATSQDFTIQLGKPWTNQVVASFTDANPKEAPAAYAAGIYWGDSNTPEAGKVVSLGGRFLVIGSRGYFNPGV